MEHKFSKTVFSKEAILKTVYLWQKDFNISISEDEYNFILNIEEKTPNNVFNAAKFNSQLDEQQLREQLNKQFGNLRDYIYNKAFAHFES